MERLDAHGAPVLSSGGGGSSGSHDAWSSGVPVPWLCADQWPQPLPPTPMFMPSSASSSSSGRNATIDESEKKELLGLPLEVRQRKIMLYFWPTREEMQSTMSFFFFYTFTYLQNVFLKICF
jgi:hypothetical protein